MIKLNTVTKRYGSLTVAVCYGKDHWIMGLIGTIHVHLA